ncbi:MAG: redoxin domain-containing protein [Desulfobacterales bacterium]
MRKSTFLLSMILFLSWFFGGYLKKAEAKPITLIKAGDFFPEVPMQVPEDAKERAYLGLTKGKTFTLKQVKADLVVVEILNVYCPICQLQASVYNNLYNLIENDPETKGRIKLIGIAAGNGKLEVKDFRDKRNVPFPVLPDQYFEMHRAIGGSRTPFTIYVRQDPSGHAGVVLGSHLGLDRNHKQLFVELRRWMTEDLASIRKESQNKAADTVIVKPLLTDKDLQEKVKNIFTTFNGEMKNFQQITLTKGSRKVFTCFVERKDRSERIFAEVISRPPPCGDCHDIHFIYVFDTSGTILKFVPIQLTKKGNKAWNDDEVDKMRKRLLGKSISQRLLFDPYVDAVSGATITSEVIFGGLSQGAMLLQELRKMGLI